MRRTRVPLDGRSAFYRKVYAVVGAGHRRSRRSPRRWDRRRWECAALAFPEDTLMGRRRSSSSWRRVSGIMPVAREGVLVLTRRARPRAGPARRPRPGTCEGGVRSRAAASAVSFVTGRESRPAPVRRSSGGGERAVMAHRVVCGALHTWTHADVVVMRTRRCATGSGEARVSAQARRASTCRKSGTRCQRRSAGDVTALSGTAGSRSVSTTRPDAAKAAK